MPVSQVKALAKKYGLKVETVERYWDEATADKGSKGYGWVYNTVQNRCRNKRKSIEAKAIGKE